MGYKNAFFNFASFNIDELEKRAISMIDVRIIVHAKHDTHDDEDTT